MALPTQLGRHSAQRRDTPRMPIGLERCGSRLCCVVVERSWYDPQDFLGRAVSFQLETISKHPKFVSDVTQLHSGLEETRLTKMKFVVLGAPPVVFDNTSCKASNFYLASAATCRTLRLKIGMGADPHRLRPMNRAD